MSRKPEVKLTSLERHTLKEYIQSTNELSAILYMTLELSVYCRCKYTWLYTSSFQNETCRDRWTDGTTPLCIHFMHSVQRMDNI